MRYRLAIFGPWMMFLAMLSGASKASVAQELARTAPINFAPNSQWEIWSGVEYGTAPNVEGTGTVSPIIASGNSTDVAETTTFAVTTTGQLKVGDLVTAAGPDIDSSLVRSPMRVTALIPNRSITVRVPLGLTPTVSHSATITPVVVGNLAAKGTGDAADGWKKTISMPVWREDDRANVPAGAYYSMGLTKDAAGPEHVWMMPNSALYAGRKLIFGIYVYQKIRGGPATWSIYWSDDRAGLRSCAPAPARPGWQWQECSMTIPEDVKTIDVGVQLEGEIGDTYYLANPVFAVGGAIGGPGNYTKPTETFVPIVHISPYAWINARVTFPAARTGGVYGLTMDPYAETGGKIAPTVGQAWGQLEGINSGDVQRATGYVRLMAWFDRVSALERSGSFLPQYVADVKSFSYMDFPLNSFDRTPDMLGTTSIQTGVASDSWWNVSLEFDRFLLK